MGIVSAVCHVNKVTRKKKEQGDKGKRAEENNGTGNRRGNKGTWEEYL